MVNEVAAITVLAVVILGIVGIGVWLIVSGLAGRAGASVARCRVCRYDLRGTPYSRVCSECGAALLEKTAIRCAAERVPRPSRIRLGLTLLVAVVLGVPFISSRSQSAPPTGVMVTPAPINVVSSRAGRVARGLRRSRVPAEAPVGESPGLVLPDEGVADRNLDSDIARLLPWDMRTVDEQLDLFGGPGTAEPGMETAGDVISDLKAMIGVGSDTGTGSEDREPCPRGG